MKKRLIAFLLVLIMVLGMLPVSAFAVDGDATRYTYHLIHEFNYVGGTRWDIQATTAAESYQLDVNKGKPTRNGYKFDGWADEANATTATYFGGELITLTKENPTKTIYAVWKPIFELHYNANGGTGAPDSQTYTALSATTTRATFTSRNQIPTKDGYTFKGWADSAAATTAQYQPGGTIAVNHADSPKTVYAVWEKNATPTEYTVTYYKNDGSANDLFYKTSDWGEPSEKFNIYWGKPTRDGYDFVGWAETRDATEAKYASGGAGGKQSWIKLDGPKVLYAVWQEAGLEPEAPRSPSDCEDQLKKNTIKLVCVGGNHPDKVITFADVSYGSDWSMGDTCRLNFYAKDAALKYSGHAPKNPEERIYVTFKWVNDKTDTNGKYLPGEWVMVETTAAVVELVDTGVEAPSQPTTAQLGNIKVTCRTNAEHSSEFPVAKCMGTTVGTVTFDSVKKQWYIDTAPMTTQLASRYDSWKGYAEGTHRLVNPDAKLNARFYYDGEKWYTEDTLAIDVCCGETPVKPTALDGSFAIVCKNNKATHPHKADYIATPSQYTISDVQMDDQGYYVTATVKVAPNLVTYNTATRVEHRLVNEQDATLTITFRYDTEATGKWTQQGMQQGELPVVEVTCKGIEEPTREDIFGALNGLVTVTCINRFWKDGNNNMDCGQGQYAAKAGIVGQDYTLVKGEDAGTWVVTFPVTNFVKSFKQNPAHHLYTKDKLSWYIRWEDNTWTSAPVEPGVDDLVKLTHAPTDWREVAKIATGGKSDCIHTHCVNSGLNVCDYGITVPFLNFNADVVSVEPEAGVPGSYIATFKVDKFVDARAKVCNDKNFPDAPRTHKLLTQETVRWRLYATPKADEKIGNNVPNHVWEAEPVEAGKDDVCTIAHNWVVTFNPDNGKPAFTQNVEYEGKAIEPAAPKKTGYDFTGWYLGEAEEPFSFDTTITSDITLTAKWEAKKANVHLMIFKSGDLSTPIVNVPYTTDKLAGDTIDLTEIDPSSYLDFDFEIDGGWYDDGMFNSYKRYLNGLQDKPAGLEKLLITGNWQNLKLIVTELVPVVYFDSLESLTAYQNDHSKTEGILHTTKARLGSALPTADAPTATREGYTFTFWSREGQTGDVTGQTVNGWTNLYANWEKKTYKVVAKLYVNGKPAYYQNEDFYTYEVSGLYGEDIDFDTIKAQAVEQAKQIKKSSASYTAVILEDHEPNAVCTTYGEHQPDQTTHYVKVNVKTEEKVVILQSFEGKTDLTTLHTTTAPYGTNVVEFLNGLGLDLDVAGYTLDTDKDGNTNWYKKDSPKWTFGANDTINGWTNVLLKYTITPHNIYAFARLNSAFAPLTSVEFGEFVKLNDATLTRLGLGSYNANNYISIGTFSFNKLPLTGDDFMSYYGDEEFDAVVAELADNIVLETGVSKEVAEKIAWTYLFKADNSDYMTEAGYPTDDENGYQLSGNLDLATVMFKAGGENVTGMPAVNYTYDEAVEIHDFYFAGDTFTMPADPTREGYSFEGWSVKVLPDENDADHLDADGADDAADETLLKAGDTYTITAGGVIFTAQWEKKTFTVKYYLPDETGAWVEKKMDTVDSVDYATYSLWTPNAEDGYEFSGWYQKTADIGVKAKVEKLYMAKEWKLYGKFTPIEYNIQYVYNDGKATSTNPTTYTVESDTITLADATGADWGKTFLEWHDENGQKITEIPTGSTGDRVITAYWNWPVYLHYLDKDDNEIESATLYVSELEPGACVLPTGEKTGYDFDGWYEFKKDIGNDNLKLSSLSKAKKWELYGRYTAKTDVSYTVKYLREGDNKVLAPEKVVTDQTFDTEVTEQAADVVGYTPDAPSKTMILDEYNKVLTFSYSANTYRYEIHYFLQEPDGSYMEKEVDTTPTGVFDTTVTITPDPNRYGAHYSYNSVKSVVSGVVTVDDPATILKLNVYYDLDFHTLTFDTMGGSRIAPVTVRHGNAVAKPKDPVNGGYIFDGWYTDKTYRTPYNFATPLTQDTTIYAKWFLIVLPGVTIKKAAPKLNTSDHFAYVQGYPNGTVKPAGNITRAETAAILFRLMDDASRKTYYSTKSGFRDVASGSWYNTYVATLNNAGVITDSANGYFRPNEAITRAELAAMLAKFSETTGAANYFNDVSARYWAANAIAICAKLGWINGYPDGSFRPDKNVTRAELMAMINRATGRAPKSADAFLPGMKTWIDNTSDKWYYLDVQEATNSHSYTVKGSETWTALTSDPNWSLYE